MIKILESIDIQDLEEKRIKLLESGIKSEVRDTAIENHVYLQTSLKSYGLFVSDNDESNSLKVLGIETLHEVERVSSTKTSNNTKTTALIVFSLFVPIVMNLASLFYLYKSVMNKEIGLIKTILILVLNTVLISTQIYLLVTHLNN